MQYSTQVCCYNCTAVVLFSFISPQEAPVRKIWVVSVMRDLQGRFPGEMCCITKMHVVPQDRESCKVRGLRKNPKTSPMHTAASSHLVDIYFGEKSSELFFFIFQGSEENNSKERVNWSWLQHRWRGEWGGNICVLHPGWCTSGPQRGTKEGRPDLVCRSSPCTPQGWAKS